MALVATHFGPHANAQPAPKQPHRIGFLSSSPPSTASIAAFNSGMQQLGYVDGRDYTLDVRFPEGDYSRLPAIARELLGTKPEVVIAVASPAIRALREASPTIPIVSASTGDPVGAGFATSLAKPGHHFTGLTTTNVDTSAKLVDMLQLIVPRLSRVGLLENPQSSSAVGHASNFRVRVARLGIEGFVFQAGTAAEIERAFASSDKQKIQALIVVGESFLNTRGAQIAGLSMKHRIPVAAQHPATAEAGALLSYGTDRLVAYRRVATYVDRILKGANAGDLPIEQPADLMLVVNMKTARNLGLTVPQELLLRAQKVIE